MKNLFKKIIIYIAAVGIIGLICYHNNYNMSEFCEKACSIYYGC